MFHDSRHLCCAKKIFHEIDTERCKTLNKLRTKLDIPICITDTIYKGHTWRGLAKNGEAGCKSGFKKTEERGEVIQTEGEVKEIHRSFLD